MTTKHNSEKPKVTIHSPGMVSVDASEPTFPLSDEAKDWMRETHLYAAIVQSLGKTAAEAIANKEARL